MRTNPHPLLAPHASLPPSVAAKPATQPNGPEWMRFVVRVATARTPALTDLPLPGATLLTNEVSAA